MGAEAIVGFDLPDLAAGTLSKFLELNPCDETLQACRRIDSEAIPTRAIALVNKLVCITRCPLWFELIAPIPAWFRLGLVRVEASQAGSRVSACLIETPNRP